MSHRSRSIERPTTPRFGANYTPSNRWFYSWLDFSVDEARRDFEDLAGIGLDHVRVFPFWPWIQPNRGLIRRQGIDDLLSLIDAAAEFDVDVAVDLIQGHMSSFDFLPSWVLTHHGRSVFEDREVRDGLLEYTTAVAEATCSRSNVFAVTLGNEVDNLWPSFAVDADGSRAWAAELLQAVREVAAGRLCLYSLYDASWYSPNHPFTPDSVVELGDLSTVHSWVFNGVSRLDGPLGEAAVSHADYLVELAAATAPDPDRPVWLQEVGAPRPDVPAESASAFVSETLRRLDSNPALWGVTWWCSHDVDRSLIDFPDREYDLGLFTVDHEPKPAAAALQAHVAERRGRKAAPTPPVRALRCPIDPLTQPERRDLLAPGSDFHREWVRLRADGPLRIAVPGTAEKPELLRRRGVGEVITR